VTVAIVSTSPLDRPGDIRAGAEALLDDLVTRGLGVVLVGPALRADELTAGRVAVRRLVAGDPNVLPSPGTGGTIAIGPGPTPTAAAALRRIIGQGEVDLVVVVGDASHPLALDAVAAAPDAMILAQRATPEAAAEIAARARSGAGRPPLYVAAPRIQADFHLHTNYSPDCATSVEELVERALALGLGALCVTDHDTIAGGVAARRYVERHGLPLHIAVASEVKTQTGEVIGIYLEEDIPPGLPFADTVEAIRAQDAFVYVPHPCDRLHAIPPADLLERLAPQIDAFETVNGRLARERFNDEAEAIAERLALPRAAGSDEHVVDGLFTAGLELPAFSDPVSLALAMQDAHIVRRPANYLGLQARKWFRTRRNPVPAE